MKCYRIIECLWKNEIYCLNSYDVLKKWISLHSELVWHVELAIFILSFYIGNHTSYVQLGIVLQVELLIAVFWWSVQFGYVSWSIMTMIGSRTFISSFYISSTPAEIGVEHRAPPRVEHLSLFSERGVEIIVEYYYLSLRDSDPNLSGLLYYSWG